MADFEELKNELIKSYQDLLELQYHEKPKAREHIKTICESLIADMVLWKIQEQCMDVDVSVGVQLDIIGKWVDIDRYFKGNKYENNKWYAYYDWDEKDQPNSLQGGMWDWDISEKPNNAPFLNYDWILVIKNKLNDDDFRTLIKLKIIKNNTNATCKNIDDEIYKLFKGVIYTVWGEKLFDKSKFTVVGSPVITDDGIASGFSVNNYIKTPNVSELSKITESLKFTSSFVYNTLSSEQTIWNKNLNFDLRLVNSSIILRTYDGSKSNAFSIRQSQHKVANGEQVFCDVVITPNLCRIKINGVEYTKEQVTDFSYLINAADKSFLIGISNAFNFYFHSSIDLKAFSITIDGKEVFSGTKDKVMELTYKYPENQTSIMNLAKTKNCLPCPSGVHLKMEGIPDNE